MNNLKDENLLKIYMLGFTNELSNIKESIIQDSILLKAYELGRIDAIIGDDSLINDNQTNEEIIKKIHFYCKNK